MFLFARLVVDENVFKHVSKSLVVFQRIREKIIKMLQNSLMKNSYIFALHKSP